MKYSSKKGGSKENGSKKAHRTKADIAHEARARTLAQANIYRNKPKKASKGMNTFKDMGVMGKAGAIGGMAGTAMQIYGANFGTTNPEDAATMTQAGGIVDTASGIASGMDKGKKKTPTYRKGVKMYRKGGKRC